MNIKRIGLAFITLTLCACVFTAKAQQKAEAEFHSFSASDAVNYALKNSVQVRNALLDIQAQRQQNKEITASALPQITANGSATYNPNVAVQSIPDFISLSTYGVLIKNNVKDGNGNPIKSPTDIGLLNIGFGAKYAGNASVSLNQLLFDGQVFVGLQARAAAIKNKVLAADVTREQIKANVYKIYYQLVVGKRQIGSLDANIDRYEKLLHDTKEIFKNGFAEKLDVDKVQVQLINLQTQKLKSQNQIEAGTEGLKFLMNMPLQDNLVLTDTLSDEELKSGILSAEYTYGDRKEVQQLKTLMDLGKYNIKRYQLSKLPTVSLGANYGENGQWQTFDNFFKGPYFSSSFIALRVSVSLFDGGAKNAKKAQATIDLKKLENNMEQLKLSIDNDVSQSRIQMTTALSTMDAQKRNIDLAQQVYNSTKLKYEQGLGSNQEISTAQADLVTAQNNYYSSLYDAIIAKINFLSAAGTL
ncbi:MAG: TolC family protein [Ginsengibacter sp.]